MPITPLRLNKMYDEIMQKLLNPETFVVLTGNNIRTPIEIQSIYAFMTHEKSSSNADFRLIQIYFFSEKTKTLYKLNRKYDSIDINGCMLHIDSPKAIVTRYWCHSGFVVECKNRVTLSIEKDGTVSC